MGEFDLFEELGLPKNEGKVYDILVQFGKLGAGEISSKSGVPYGRIYDILTSLVQKGLVEVVPEKTKKYIPSNPDSLLKLVEKKQNRLEKAKEKVENMKQFYEVKEKNPLVVGEGKKAFWKINDEMKKPEKYSYNIRWTSEIRPESLKRTKKRLREGVDIQDLVRYNNETEREVKKRLRVNKHIRKLENEGFVFSVQDDEEVMLGLITSNITLLIRNKPFAKIMKKMFLETYKNAEKID